MGIKTDKDTGKELNLQGKSVNCQVYRLKGQGDAPIFWRFRNFIYFCSGEMAEWSIAAVLKTVDPQGSGGSNPSLSADPEEKVSEER